MRWLTARGWRGLSYAAATILLIVSAAWTITDYARYAVDPETAFAFEETGLALVRQARNDARAGHQVYVADRFARDWTSVPYLIGGSYTPIPDGQQPTLNPAQPSTLFVWPYEDWSRIFAPVASALQVQVTAGPLAKGDLDAQPHVGYLTVQLEPLAGAPLQPEVQFENGLQLLGHSVEAIDAGHWRLRTLWQLDRAVKSDQTFFVHLLAVNQVLNTKDGDSGDGFYPLRAWRPGDVIVDERILDVPPQADRAQLLVELGVYDRATQQRIKAVKATPPVIKEAVLLGGPTASGPGAVGP